jgi:glycosyltransferase involved in cell wall biosynthesis
VNDAGIPACVFIQQDGLDVSGVATYGLTLWRHLDACHLVLLNVDDPLPDELVAGGRITAVPRSASHDPSAVAEALASAVAPLGDRRVVIVPNNGDTPWSGTERFMRSLPASRREQVRVCAVVHGDHEPVYAMMKRMAPLVAEYVGVSRVIAARMASELARPATAVASLPCPLPFPPAAAREVNGDGPLRLLYAGRLEEPQKRVSRLPVLFEELASAGVAFTATLAGDGPARSIVEAECQRVSRRHPGVAIRLSGAIPRESMEELYLAHDVLLLVSAYEGTPLVLGEAMALGLCPAVMDIDSGLPDLLVDGENARVVKQGDVTALAHAVGELARDRSTLARLSGAAAATAARELSLDAHLAKLTAVLDRCFSHPAPELRDVPVLDPTAVPLACLKSALRDHPPGPCVVVGAGMMGRKVVDTCQQQARPLAAWLDSDPAQWGRCYRGLRVEPIATVIEHPDSLIVVGSLAFASEIAERIHELFQAAGRPAPPLVVLQ